MTHKVSVMHHSQSWLSNISVFLLFPSMATPSRLHYWALHLLRTMIICHFELLESAFFRKINCLFFLWKYAFTYPRHFVKMNYDKVYLNIKRKFWSRIEEDTPDPPKGEVVTLPEYTIWLEVFWVRWNTKESSIAVGSSVGAWQFHGGHILPTIESQIKLVILALREWCTRQIGQCFQWEVKVSCYYFSKWHSNA